MALKPQNDLNPQFSIGDFFFIKIFRIFVIGYFDRLSYHKLHLKKNKNEI